MVLALLMMACGLTINAQETNQDPDAQYATELLKPGTVAPEFVISGPDSCCNIPLSQLRGKYVMLEFWASWCPDCRKDMPEVKAMYERFGKKNVKFVGVSFDTDKAAWKNFIEKNGLTWLHHSELKKWKKGTKIDQDYQVKWIPSYYLIDPEGKVVLGTVQHQKIAAKLAELEAQGLLKDSACCGQGSCGKQCCKSSKK